MGVPPVGWLPSAPPKCPSISHLGCSAAGAGAGGEVVCADAGAPAPNANTNALAETKAGTTDRTHRAIHPHFLATKGVECSGRAQARRGVYSRTAMPRLAQVAL